jgi:hypothetical protein
MRKLIIAGIVLVLLLGGFIVYMEIDKRKFIDSISSVSPVVDQPVNVSETTREVTQASEEPKFQEVDPDELLAAVNRVPEQFGYTEASITYAKLATKSMSGEKLTPDEKVAYMEASLYLWPNKYTRRSLILQKWVQSKGPNFPPRDGFSDEDLAELKDLGISVVYRGDAMIINPRHDYIRRDLVEEDADEEPSPPASDTVFSEGIGEDTDFPQRRSEGTPVMPEPETSVTSDHVHHGDRHVHEPPTIKTPVPMAAKGVEADGWEGLSLKQREQAKQLFDQYGTEEGLRRFRDIDPEAARQFERERRKPPVPSEPSGALSTR